MLDSRSFNVTRLPELFKGPHEGQYRHCRYEYDEGQWNAYFQVVVESIPPGTHDKYIGWVGYRAGEARRGGQRDSHHGTIGRDG